MMVQKNRLLTPFSKNTTKVFAPFCEAIISANSVWDTVPKTGTAAPLKYYNSTHYINHFHSHGRIAYRLRSYLLPPHVNTGVCSANAEPKTHTKAIAVKNFISFLLFSFPFSGHFSIPEENKFSIYKPKINDTEVEMEKRQKIYKIILSTSIP